MRRFSLPRTQRMGSRFDGPRCVLASSPPDIADEGMQGRADRSEEALHDWGAWMVVHPGTGR